MKKYYRPSPKIPDNHKVGVSIFILVCAVILSIHLYMHEYQEDKTMKIYQALRLIKNEKEYSNKYKYNVWSIQGKGILVLDGFSLDGTLSGTTCSSIRYINE